MKRFFIPVLLLAFAFSAGLSRADDKMAAGSNDMKDMPMDSRPAVKTHHGVGVVKKVDVAKGSVTISHGAIKSIGWPAMTMTFAVKEKGLLSRLAEGQKVEFDFVQEGSDSTIVKLK